MSGATRVRASNLGDLDTRPVLRPAGNNAPVVSTRKEASKPSKKLEKPSQELDSKEKKGITRPPVLSERPSSVSVILKRQEVMLGSNLAMSGSCSSDASSSDSSQSRASSGRTVVGRRSGVLGRKKQCGTKMEPANVGMEKVEKGINDANAEGNSDEFWGKKRCSWVTANTDLSYAAFHDEEWGVPVHDDKKLFELLCLSGALAELTWPTILSKRHLFREVFLDFDPLAIAKLNEKKVVAPGSPANSLLSEQKLRAIIENARQICKVTEEYGSFNKYIWNFINHKPLISQFRYQRQVPVKTPKSEFISKDLVRRGFRSVGPSVVYSFMQVAGLTNDHLISCFRFNECMAEAESGVREKDAAQSKAEMKKDDETDLGLSSVIAKLAIS